MLESILIRVPPGPGSDGAYMHRGEGFLYMLEGTIEIWLDEIECHVRKHGDSFWFESNLGHRRFNRRTRKRRFFGSIRPRRSDVVQIWCSLLLRVLKLPPNSCEAPCGNVSRSARN
jgi:uncharacterized cupin superfamily protein